MEMTDNVKVIIKNPHGTLEAIESKSQAHRYIIGCALSDKPNKFTLKEMSQDIEATISCLNSLGANISTNTSKKESDLLSNNDNQNNEISIEPIKIVRKKTILDCNESGSTFRFLLPLACALESESIFVMKEGLAKRPIKDLYNQLIKNGCKLSIEGSLPFHTKGKLEASDYVLPGDVSSQYISGLLMALPLLDRKSSISLSSTVESLGYIEMTLDMLKTFHIDIKVSSDFMKYEIEGNQKYISSSNVSIEKDWSNSAFFLAAGALSDKEIIIKGLNLESLQKDKMILDILKKMGADIAIDKTAISIKKKELKALDIDVGQIPDLVPILSILCSLAKGTSKIYNAKRLRIKESDRIESTYQMLKALGADVTSGEDFLIIKGKPQLNGGQINSFNDHRIAMSGAIAAIVSREPVIIENAKAINKSYPSFFDDFKKVGGQIQYTRRM